MKSKRKIKKRVTCKKKKKLEEFKMQSSPFLFLGSTDNNNLFEDYKGFIDVHFLLLSSVFLFLLQISSIGQASDYDLNSNAIK